MSDTTSYHIPDDRLYDGAQHLWVQHDPATHQMTVGLDLLGLASMGDLAYVTLRPVGTAVRRGEPLGSLEAAKMTGDLVAPISGTLLARNAAVLRDPSLINRDPYGEGWLVVIAPADWASEAELLIAPAERPDWVAAETERYRTQGWIV